MEIGRVYYIETSSNTHRVENALKPRNYLKNCIFFYVQLLQNFSYILYTTVVIASDSL